MWYESAHSHYQLTSLNWSFRERNAVRLAADLSILVSRGGVRFSETRYVRFPTMTNSRDSYHQCSRFHSTSRS